MSTELLTEETVVAYLIDKGVISAAEWAEVEVLTGGVSNVVLAITTKEKKLVLKQALAELKVAEKWKADQRRAIVEANAIALFHKLSPDQVPELIFLDAERFILILDRVPVGSTVWKSDLLAGVINPDVAGVLGKTLAKWHNFGESNKEARLQFMEDSLFEQLRIDPFYRFVAAKNKNLGPIINKLIAELEGDQTTIVHGDFSPKNIMVGMDEQVYILDFEVTHVGNPVFDLAFLVAHLLCKLFRTNEPLDEKMLTASALRFINSYKEIRSISKSLSLHTGLIALARVEGKSPVNYLNKVQQERLVKYTKGILGAGNSIPIEQLFEEAKA
ncbi:MAG: aminoglycoside phosphotransferase family protein [Actinobacteria bacterium]|nr:aminoglycoside phosphotransferase family protein [Actinomycetota bacterium]